MQLMLDEVKAIGLQLGQGNYATMAFHHDRSPEARVWAQRFFERMKARWPSIGWDLVTDPGPRWFWLGLLFDCRCASA
jgi:hypothetical protein